MTSENKNASQPAGREPIPWKWLLLGFGIAFVLIMLIWFGFQTWLRQIMPETAVAGQPTLIRLTAPSSPVPSLTPTRATATPIPTFTPIPTPDVAVAPDELTVGFYAVVANTDGLGVTIRGGPSTQNIVIIVAEEGAPLFIIGGPQEAGDLIWWQVRLADGTEGWAAGSFLEPAPAP